MNETETNFYCPACGEGSHINRPVLAPGDSTVTCPECGTRFIVRVGFEEVEEEESQP